MAIDEEKGQKDLELTNKTHETSNGYFIIIVLPDMSRLHLDLDCHLLTFWTDDVEDPNINISLRRLIVHGLFKWYHYWVSRQCIKFEV